MLHVRQRLLLVASSQPFCASLPEVRAGGVVVCAGESRIPLSRGSVDAAVHDAEVRACKRGGICRAAAVDELSLA